MIFVQQSRIWSVNRWRRGGVAALITLTLFAVIGTSPAHANTYRSELAAGWTWPAYTNNVSGFGGAFTLGTSGGGGGSPLDTERWNAPTDELFNGFAYSDAVFKAVAAVSPYTGAWESGIVGSSLKASGYIVFPWTDDCTVYQSSDTNGDMDWTHDSAFAQTGGSKGEATCATTGNTTGWNYTNIEKLFSGGASAAGDEWSSLSLQVSCVAEKCVWPSSGLLASDPDFYTATEMVKNLSVQVDDPNGQPSLTSASWTGGGTTPTTATTSWYTTTADAPALQVNASDPSGICDLRVNLAGAAGNTATSGDLVSAPAVTPAPDAVIGAEFAPSTVAAEPCASSATGWSWTLPSTLASDTYTTTIQGANAGQYEGAGFSSSGNSTLATTTIHVDNTVPTVTIADNTPSSTDATVTVNVGPSGFLVNQLGVRTTPVCTENGNTESATQVSGAASGAGTTVWKVPITADGTAGISCAVTNDDVNQALSNPVATFQSPTYIEGKWSSDPVGIIVTAPAGDNLAGCYLDGEQLPFTASTASSGNLTVTANGQHTVSCLVRAADGSESMTDFAVWIDSATPTASLTSNAEVAHSAVVNVTVTDANWTLRGGKASLVVWLQNIKGGAAFPVDAVTAVSANEYRIDVPDGVVAPGRYHLIADAKDAAGISSTITLGTLTLPLREMTNITVSAGRVAGRQQARTPTVIAGVRTSGSAALASQSVSTRTLNVRWGQTITLGGRLTQTGKAIAGAQVRISQRILGTTKITTLGVAHTNGSGKWSFRVTAGPSRDLYASYLGTATLRSATAALVESSTASVSISAGAAHAGGTTRFSGTLFGGHIPAGGLNLVVYYSTVGFSGQGTLGNAHVNSAGRWSFKQLFSAQSRGQTYRIWVTVNPAAGWPYRATASPTITRKVG